MKKAFFLNLLLLPVMLVPLCLGFAQDLTYNESPVLAAEVAAGNLPPVAERIPLNPRVVPVYEEIGQYGGTWRRAYTGISDRWGPTKLIEERAIEFRMDENDELILELNWVDQFEANADSSEYTVHIREGLRWSDGVPVTTEDVRFWYEDLLLNTELFPTMPANLIINGEPVTVEIVDTYTFKIMFAGPYPIFPQLVAGTTPGAIGQQGTSFVVPSHYMKNYHPAYASADAIAAAVAEYGVEDWTDLWGEGPVHSWWLNPDVPVLTAWKIAVPPPAETVVMVRNPYYHAVDAAGNQLPYIDEIVHLLATDGELVGLWTSQGLIDLQSRHLGSSLYDFLTNSESLGNYTTALWRGSSTDALFFNLNTSDPVLAELFDNVEFRHALSVAINRDELLAIVYNGLGEARQASPVTGSLHYDPEFEQKWTTFEPELANSLLDGIGLTERNADGIRLKSDGTPLAFTITTTSASPIMIQFVQRYWGALGIAVDIEVLERADYEARAAAGDIEVGDWEMDRNVLIGADSRRFLGTMTDGPWAPLYAQWYASQGQSGIEPPADHPIRDVWAAWENAKSASTSEEANQFIQDMVTVHRENIWIIGLVGEVPRIYAVSNRMHNFPQVLLHEGTLRDIGLAQPVQFYFDPVNP